MEQSTPTTPQEHQNNTHGNENKYTQPQQPNSCLVSVMVIEKKEEDNGNKVHRHMQLCICHHHMFLMSSIITELDSVFNVSKKS